MESYYQKAQREAGERLAALVALPVPADNFELGAEGYFDPWPMFNLYGSYSGEFDECAIDVLEELQSGDKKRHDLGAEMFRELLCNMGLCDYGTSPRCCFPTRELRELLPVFIEKWKTYSALQWSPD